MLIDFPHVPELTVWDALCAKEPAIESLALQSSSNTSQSKESAKNKDGDDEEGKRPPIYLPVEFFERESYPNVDEIQKLAEEIPGLWEKLQTQITSEDIPRVLSTWPWPIVNEIAVEMMTKTTFDIVNFALEKTKPDHYTRDGEVTIAGGDAFKGIRKKSTKHQPLNETPDSIATSNRTRYAVEVEKPPKSVTII